MENEQAKINTTSRRAGAFLCVIFLGMVLSVAGAFAQQGVVLSHLPDAAKAQIKDSMTDYVLDYGNYTGYLHFEAEGDAGSIIRIHLYYNGFYIRPILTLSKSKQGQIRYSPQYEDRYEIIPKAFTANINVQNTKHCRSQVGEKKQLFAAHLSAHYCIPDPPVNQTQPIQNGRFVLDSRVANWLYENRSKFHGDKVRTGINIISRQADGGKAHLSLDVYSIMKGTLTRSWGPPYTSERWCKIMFGTGDKDEHARVTLRGATWKLEGHLPIEKKFSLEDPTLSFSGTSSVEYGCQPYEETLSDTQFTLRYRFSMAAKIQIDAVLEPVDPREKIWEPIPGETREFKLTLNDPKHQEVSGVRFALENTSRHPGIAVNAGNHIRGRKCGDCKESGKKDETWPWETFLKAGDQNSYTINRNYTHYNPCPIDKLPDIYFTDVDNPGWQQNDNPVSENLQYTMSQSIERDQVDQDSYTVKVRVMDGAASAKLRAYVNLGGIWYEAKAKGDTADTTKTALLLPLDKDGDGMRDGWERQWAVDEPDDDKDSLMGNSHVGDGVSVFEEYRGIYAGGRHYRMSPVYKDIFVHDYSGMFKSDLRKAASLFRNQEMSLWVLNGDEFKYDVINYQDGEQKLGDQYIIVAMALSQCPGLDLGWAGGRAAHVGPPVREANTVMIKYKPGPLAQAMGLSQSQTLSGILAHEIGHNINLSHHGETDRIRTIKGQDVWVACLGGQHSGQADCIMKYNVAQYFIDLDFVPQTGLGRLLSGQKLVEYTEPYGQRNFFCKDKGDSPQTGPATVGGCLGEINVKSY